MIYKTALVTTAILAGADAYAPAPKMTMKTDMPSMQKVATAAIAGMFSFGAVVPNADAFSKADSDSLSYSQVKGSGFANRCPAVEGTGSINVNGKANVVDMCLEPLSWQVEQEVADKKGNVNKEFVNTKLMTRQTYSLAGISGTMEQRDGKLSFVEEDGIDYAATTVQLPGGERVPFLFSLKDIIAKGTTSGPIKEGFEMGGAVTVPSYRTGLFLDPKGRGTTTGYDFSGALAARQTGGVGANNDLFNEENKKFDVLKGDVEFQVKNVNAAEKEFGGIFVSTQPSDTDMGAKTPKNILTKGIFYARLE